MPKQIFEITRPPEAQSVSAQALRSMLYDAYERYEWTVNEITEYEGCLKTVVDKLDEVRKTSASWHRKHGEVWHDNLNLKAVIGTLKCYAWCDGDGCPICRLKIQAGGMTWKNKILQTDARAGFQL
jgi:hypothetical protein